MTAQRDRLAALLDAVTDDVLAEMRYGDDYYAMVADALLARGVRVVDEQTLPPPMWRQRMLDILDGNGPVASVMWKVKDGTWL